MIEFRELRPDANPFVERIYPSVDGAAHRIESGISSSGAGKPLRRFVGFLGKVMDDGRRKVYTTSGLDEGVEVPNETIRVLLASPENETDGLKRDVVWVDTDADIFYFSTRPRASRDPSGGEGFPRGESIVGP